MIAKLEVLLKDPVWWLTTVLLSIALNLLSDYLYEKLKAYRLENYVHRMTNRTIQRASYDSMISQLISDPKFLTNLREKSAYEKLSMGLFPIGVSSYLMASAEYNWHIEGNNPSISATLVYFIQSLVMLVVSLVAFRSYLRTRKILNTAKKLQNLGEAQ